MKSHQRAKQMLSVLCYTGTACISIASGCSDQPKSTKAVPAPEPVRVPEPGVAAKAIAAVPSPEPVRDPEQGVAAKAIAAVPSPEPVRDPEQGAASKVIAAVPSPSGDPHRVGILLKGERTDSALAAIHDYDAGDRTTEDEIGITAQGSRLDRTNLSIAITLLSSVGEVNDMLRSVDGRIVSMLSHRGILLVKIPDPGKIKALEEIAAKVEASPIVRRVSLAHMGGFDMD